MFKRASLIGMIVVLANMAWGSSVIAMKSGDVLVLSYHAIPAGAVPGDSYSVPQNKFAEQMEYLRTHGYQPVSVDDILQAGQGKKELPGKPVLLTFDDAYISYYEYVVPFLEKLNYPSVLAVVGSFIDNPPKGLPEPLMNWEQIREVYSNRLVEVASHTYDLHKGIQYNPSGNVGSAVRVLAYDPYTGNYETEDMYRARLERDFKAQEDLFKRHLGFVPRVIAWPYGRYNAISIEIARGRGFVISFTLEEGFARVDNQYEINRNLIENTPIDFFIKTVKKPDSVKPMIRAVQVDLDLIYSDSYEEMDKNLGKLIDRLVDMNVNTVFLQAFADPEGSGNIKSVYFHNRVLPVRADIFSHAVHQIMIRDMAVYAWMPTLSIELPDKKQNERLKVRAAEGGKPVPGSSWYRRLTPFSKEVRTIVKTLYEDLASHSQVRGILFQDDAYLTDFEDFHPDAINSYRERFGKDMLSENLTDNPFLAEQWARYKTEALIKYTDALKEGVRKYHPNALFARNIYSIVIEDPGSELWFAQNYKLFLENYDQVVVMAYPRMEKINEPAKWLNALVGRTGEIPHGIEKTVFKLQAYDWRKEVWIEDRVLLEEVRDVLAAGGRHIAYYPDNFRSDRPALNIIKLEMSTRTYPFMP